MNEIFRNKYFKHKEINLASKTAKLRSLSFLQSKSQVFYTFWKNAILIRGQAGEQGSRGAKGQRGKGAGEQGGRRE
jgi:hypothetical protein